MHDLLSQFNYLYIRKHVYLILESFNGKRQNIKKETVNYES